MSVFKFICGYLKHRMGQVMLVIVISVISAISLAGGSLLLTNMVESLIDYELNQFVRVLTFSVIAWSVGYLSRYVFNLMSERIVQSVMIQMREDIVEQLQQMDADTFHQQQASDYTAWLLTDLKVIEERLLRTVFNIGDAVIQFIAASIALITLHYSLLIMVVILALGMLLLPSIFSQALRRAASDVASSEEHMMTTAGHWIEGFDTLNDFDQKQVLLQRISPSLQVVRSAKIADIKVNEQVALTMGLASVASQIGTLFLSGYLAIIQVVPVGTILATGNLSGTIFSRIQQLSSLVAQYKSGGDVAEKISQFLSLKNDEEKSVDTCLDSHAEQPITLETTNVSYTFKNGHTLKYPDITLSGTQNVVISGDSGVGKSVFFKLLTGDLMHYEGSMKLNGIEVSERTLSDIKRMVGYVRQDTYIFNGSIIDNITLFDQAISQTAIDRSIEQSGLTQVINQLPDGASTVVGKDGVSLSGGQVQRIGLARALARQKPLMLFDEITANLDKATAQSIEEHIGHLHQSLNISISHHL